MIALPDNSITAVILGTAQDAGIPHIGCQCATCTTGRVEFAACLAIVDGRKRPFSVTLIDATPDIKHQLNLLASALGPHPKRPYRLRQPDAIFLTHAHMGHIGGLPQLGPEAMAVQQLPVFASPGLVDLLAETTLWRPLVANLNLRPLAPNETVTLAEDLAITAVPVPHRDEWGIGTYAYRVQGPAQSLLYLPDIDAWEQWPAAKAELSAVDVALVDASFYSEDELPGRTAVAHPLVPHTLQFFADLPCQLILTHLNHSNPVWEKGSEGETAVNRANAQIGRTGQLIKLG